MKKITIAISVIVAAISLTGCGPDPTDAVASVTMQRNGICSFHNNTTTSNVSISSYGEPGMSMKEEHAGSIVRCVIEKDTSIRTK